MFPFLEGPRVLLPCLLEGLCETSLLHQAGEQRQRVDTDRRVSSTAIRAPMTRLSDLYLQLHLL
jgi:hypothetical protein